MGAIAHILVCRRVHDRVRVGRIGAVQRFAPAIGACGHGLGFDCLHRPEGGHLVGHHLLDVLLKGQCIDLAVGHVAAGVPRAVVHHPDGQRGRQAQRGNRRRVRRLCKAQHIQGESLGRGRGCRGR